MSGAGDGHAPRTGFGTTRIEALSDGIFAVAMTLLVLDIKLPGDEPFASSGELFAHLWSLARHYLLYFVTFIVLGMLWIGHHAQFHFIRYVDHTLLWINLMFLFVITSIPFATDLLGDYHELNLPYAIYGSKLVFAAVLMILQVLHLRRRPVLAEPTLTAAVARKVIVRAALFACVPLLSMAMMLYNTQLALYLYFLLPVIHFLPGRVDELQPPDADAA
jgi:uncharacterized membrane protein